MLDSSLFKLFKKETYDLKTIDFKTLWYELQSLDSQNYGSWPIFLRVFILMLIVLMTSVMGYTLFISNQLHQQKALESQYQTLIDSQQKLAIKVGETDKNKLEIGRIRQQVQHAIEPLQPDSKMAEVMEQLNTMAMESGVVFQNLSVAEKVFSVNERESINKNNNKVDTDYLEEIFVQGEFSEQLISLTVSGNYHNFGEFFNRLAFMDHAITINDYEVTNNAMMSDIQKNNLNHPLLLTMILKVYQSHKVQEPISN